MSSEKYNFEYQRYAIQKAKSYSTDKFEPITPWGVRNYVRERLILDLIKSTGIKRRRILDLGCASGHTTVIAALENPLDYFYGVDIGEAFIVEANKKKQDLNLSNLEFACESAEKYIGEKDFDLIICAEIIEHVENLENFFDNLNKLLKKNGRLLITTPNLNGDGTPSGRLLRMFGLRKFVPATDFTEDGILNHGDQHIREFEYKTLNDLLIKNSFKVTYFSGVLNLDLYFNEIMYKVISKSYLLSKFFRYVELLSSKNHYYSNKFARHLVVICEKN